MFTHRDECPVCRTEVSDWSSRCPKCRYHPDCDDRDCYNRAQDDVALIARYPVKPRGSHARHSWRQLLPSLLRRRAVTA
jgi:hypothetical protein